MKGKALLKVLSLAMASAVVLSTVALPTQRVKAEEGMVPLFKYKTETPINLHDKQIQVSKDPIYEKRQFRSAWVSTVSNLDFPSKPGLTQEEFKAEFYKVLEDFEALNLNAVTLQVRPMNDAFYKSDLNPWSAFLTGEQGKDPGWDPLKWMIEESHKKNMEFHAWFNPYRVAQAFQWDKPTEEVMKEELGKLADNNFAKQHPEYVIRFDNKLILDPSVPEVQTFIKDTVLEVVKNYDVDAIHFDDYFYPYKVTRKDPATQQNVTYIFGDRGEDKASFEKYGKGFTDIKAWRRNSIDTMIKSVAGAIKKEKPYVKFGISPFGIWGHYDTHPTGSVEGEGSHTPISSSASYDDIYADTRKWVKEGWIDYITPQIYWSFAQTAAPYGELADWWANVVKGTNCQLYIGHANYKHTDNSSWDTDWQNPDEIGNQLKFNAQYKDIKGSSFFSLKHLRLNKFGATDIIRSQYFNVKALVPAMPWLDNNAPKAAVSVAAVAKDKSVELTWKDNANNDAAYYVVYRFEGDKLGDTENPKNIVTTIRRNGAQVEFKHLDDKVDATKTYTYAVTAVDRLHNESKAINAVYQGTEKKPQEDKEVLPETGSPIGFGMIVTLGTMITTLGASMFIFNKRK